MKIGEWIGVALVAIAMLAPAGAKAGNAQQDFAQGFELVKAGKLSEAVVKFEKGLKAEPDNAAAHFYLAEAYLGLKQNDKAKKHYQESLRLDPFGGVAEDANKRLAQLGGGGAATGSATKPSNSRYAINGDEVYDKKTDLTWQRCSVGQNWKDDIGCAGVIKSFPWDEVKKIQGRSPWRVPTKDELVTLIDRNRDRWPTINIEAFPDMDVAKPCYFGSPVSGVDFRDGSVYVNDYFSSCGYYAVRLVRGGQ